MQIKLKPGVKERFDKAFPKTEESTRLRIERLRAFIDHAQDKIQEIQDACPHTDHLFKMCSNTGNWCPQDDSYWTEVRCIDCEARLRFDQIEDHEWARGKRGTKVRGLT